MAARAQTRPIIIRRHEADADHGHHGGAWKVAYADFMTAMMAFFLLMWIVSSATKDQLNGLADYFTPASVSMTAKGGLGALGGTTIGPKGVLNQSDGAAKARGTDSGKSKEKTPDAHPMPQMTPKASPAAAATPNAKPVIVPGGAKDKAAKDKAGDAAKVVTVIKTVDAHADDDAHFKAVQHEITQAMQASPELRPLLKNVMFEKTPQGLRIQIVDQNHKPMFASGSAKVDGPTLELMRRLGKAISGLPNKIRISGHTDSVPYANGAHRDNWQLSSDRANATRRVFLSVGVAPDRVTRISGLADTVPLNPDNPRDPRNRRISVLLTYQKGEVPAAEALKGTGASPAKTGTPPSPPAKTGTAPSPSPAPAAGDAPVRKEANNDTGTAAPQDTQAGPLARTYAAVTLDDLRKAGE